MPKTMNPVDVKRNQRPLWLSDQDDWQLKQAVEAAGISRNQWLTDAVREKIARQNSDATESKDNESA